tara:strand:+ start:3161 stop:3970 length:810 start_codon:yes stop_codon:yes gene_type:complete
LTKLIAEIGWNHMGDMELAKEMIKAASDAGADIVKFQTWSEKNLKKGPWDTDGRRDIYKKAELKNNDYDILLDCCLENNIQFCTSIFNINDIAFLDNDRIKLIKIPSHEIHNYELITKVIDNFDFTIISTGASLWSEILELKKILRNNENKYSILHCVSSYPCPIEKINFKRYFKLRELFKNVGYSGHYHGVDDAIFAIANQATFVEKHFTIDKDLPGRDNKFALLPNEFAHLSSFRDLNSKMMIDNGLDYLDIEKDTYENYRGRWSKI